jgi:hypothetical protein
VGYEGEATGGGGEGRIYQAKKSEVVFMGLKKILFVFSTSLWLSRICRLTLRMEKINIEDSHFFNR